MLRTRLIASLALAVGVAGFTIWIFPGPGCACTPDVDEQPIVSLGSAFHDLDAAQQEFRRAKGHYADAARKLREVTLPTGATITVLSASQKDYLLRVDSGGRGGRSCIMSGGATSDDSPRRFTLSCHHDPPPNER